MKWILQGFLIVFFMISCSSLTHTKVSPEIPPIHNPEFVCFQNVLKSNSYFTEEFKVDFDTLQISLYATEKYYEASSRTIDKVIVNLAKDWFNCYPEATEIYTLFIYSKNQKIISAYFLTHTRYP